jgi:hypothetical protein
VWLKLSEPIDLNLGGDVPFSDALKKIKGLTKSDDLPHGVQFYVAPSRSPGETQKSADSPVSFEMEGVPLSTCIDLLTDSLELTYRVRDDGIVVIKPVSSDDDEDMPPPGHGHDTIEYLRAKLAEAKLRAEIATFRMMEANPGMMGMGGMGGGMRGMMQNGMAGGGMGGGMGAAGMGGGGMGGGGMGGMGGGGMGGAGIVRGGMRSRGMR